MPPRFGPFLYHTDYPPSTNSSREQNSLTISCTRTISACGMNHPNPKLAESFRERVTRFLFPTESDEWLARFRIGLGLHVVLYTFSLRSDCNYLLAATNPGLIGRSLSVELLSSDSP